MKKQLTMILFLLTLLCGTITTKAAITVEKVALGNVHSAVIKSDGSLWMWGYNLNGELGIGTLGDEVFPVKIMDDVEQVSLGSNHSAAIKKDGTLWIWGDNEDGQLGNGSNVDSRTPIKIMDNVIYVSLGGDSSAAIKKDGSLWMWGDNINGELGNGTTMDRNVPTYVMDDVVFVSTSTSSSTAIKKDGSLWMWGSNRNGQLGDGTTVSSSSPVKIMEDVIIAKNTASLSAAIKEDGSLWMWGDNSEGAFGIGNTEPLGVQTTPIKVLDNVKDVSLGYSNLVSGSYGFSIILKPDGRVWASGGNSQGQLGDGTTNNNRTKMCVMDSVASVSCGESISAAIKEDGSLWMWGSNAYGRFGIGSEKWWESILVPVKIMDVSYQISYVSNESDNVPLPIFKEAGEDLTLSTEIPTRIGYTFLGWSEDESAEQVDYAAGAMFTKNQDTTLYAVWEPTKYQITYNANRGTGAPKATAKLYGTDIILSDTVPTREGHTFLGWAESATSMEAEYQSGSIYTEEKDLTLYAVWKPDTYIIAYNANGGSSALESQTKTYGKTLVLSSNIPVKTGYTFMGWSESKTATNANYQAGGNYEQEKGVTLYAVWKINTYIITYNTNGGSEAPSKQTKIYGIDLKLSDVNPTKSGYTFLGWSETANTTNVKYQSGDSFKQDQNITLYAVWRADNYSVSYHANGGSNAPDSQTKVYGTNLILSSKIPTRIGYTFNGWAESATATSATYQASGIYTAEKETTLYAVWKINTYTITYDTNGGSEAPSKQIKTYGVDLKLSVVNPIRPGYTFLGWGKSATDTNATYQSAGNYTENQGITLYAVWKLNTYQVTYQLNGGSGSFSAQTKNHGEELELSSDKPVKDGYVFQGWTTEVNGTNVNYQAGGTYALEDDVVLYAVWEKEKIIAQKQTICVKTNITKEYKKNSKFKLGATAKTKLTYQSTNKKVAAVSKKGVVTIKGYGTAKIKITAAATEYYKKASKTVKISIVPAKMTGLKVTSSEKGVLLSTWKKNKQMSGYEVQFSTSKKFSANKTMIGTLPANSTYTRAKNLKSGKTYYARIRGYRKVKGIQVFGLWSDVKKIKIK